MYIDQAVRSYCLSLPGVFEDFPFGEDWDTYRHRDNNRIFAAMYERLGFTWVNLKCDPMRAQFLRDIYPAIIPAYHMNKEHWNSVRLDGSVPEEELHDMIYRSYLLTSKPSRNRIDKS